MEHFCALDWVEQFPAFDNVYAVLIVLEKWMSSRSGTSPAFTEREVED